MGLFQPRSSRPAFAWGIVVLFCVVGSLLAVSLHGALDTNILRGFDLFFALFFALELMARTSVCSATGQITVRQFVTGIGFWCDILAILPVIIEWLIPVLSSELTLIRISRLFRAARVFRFLRAVSLGTLVGAVCTVVAVIW